MADDATQRAVTHYAGSKGPVEISSMPRTYAANALAKLERDEPHRADEIAALRAHVSTLDEAYAESQATGAAEEGPPPLGHNQPPADEEPAVDGASFEALKAHADDLLTEARNWADGVAIESDAQASEVARLIRSLQRAGNLLDEARGVEKKPLDEQIAEIQERYNAYIAGLKSKNSKPGSITRALDALDASTKRWLKAKDDERREREAAAQAEAARLATAAREAQQIADPADLAAMEAAVEAIDAAMNAQRDADRIARETVTVKGADGSRAIGLRKTYRPFLTDQKAAVLHYMRERPEAFINLVNQLAERDVRDGKRSIPGFDVREELA
jgi:hypothetical protein